MKVIVIKNQDGTCTIVHPCAEMFDEKSKTREYLRSINIDFKSDEEVLDYIIKKDVPAGASYRVTDSSNLPSDRAFRNAWTDHNKTETVDVHIGKAKEIHRNNMRYMREPLLVLLDIEYMIASENDDKEAMARIAARKRELRDVTKVKLPDDVKKLRDFLPECLKTKT